MLRFIDIYIHVFRTKESKSKAATRVECICDYRQMQKKIKNKIEENTPACTAIKKTDELDQKLTGKQKFEMKNQCVSEG